MDPGPTLAGNPNVGDFTGAARLAATFYVAGPRCHFVSRPRASWGIHSSGTLNHTEYSVPLCVQAAASWSASHFGR